MMKIEDQAKMGVRFDDESSPLSIFSAHATAGHGSEEVMKLRTDNLRLKQLVAELLIENQQLRQRYCGPRKDGPAGSHHSDN